MSTEERTKKIQDIITNLSKTQEKITDIILTPGILRKKQWEMIGKLKARKIELKTKYYKIVREEIINDERELRIYDRLIEKGENEKCKLTYLLESKKR